jgi:DNA-binding GntR family transcriptional regulator
VNPLRRDAEGTVRDQVRNALRAAIISGELVPGQVYPAPVLGARFGVSSTPVREAMFDLVAEGLVVVHPNKGFRVTEMSDSGLDNVAAVRMLIEPAATRDVVPLIPDGDVAGLRALAEPAVAAAATGDLAGYVVADRVFHLALLGYSGNDHLLTIVTSLRAQTRLGGLSRLVASGKLDDAATEHLELLDLIQRRDAVGVEVLMRHHIGHIRDIWPTGP